MSGQWFEYTPPCGCEDSFWVGSAERWAAHVEEVDAEGCVMCGECQEYYPAAEWVARPLPARDPVGAHLRLAAQHLLTAASPDTANPTPSTLAAALAMSHAGLVVTGLDIPHASLQTVRVCVGATAALLGMRHPKRDLNGAVCVVTDGMRREYDDADGLAYGLRALLEVAP